MQLLQLLGRFHVVVLHLPIGFIFLAFLMEMTMRLKKPPEISAQKPAVRFTLFWGMVSAMTAACFGYLLSRDGGYDEDFLRWHKWLGFATAALSGMLYYAHLKMQGQKIFEKAYLPLFCLTMIVLTWTGHAGGSLTHGSGYLFENAESDGAEMPSVANIDSAEVFTGAILPVLKSRCGNCHNPSRKKGDLVLLTKEDILKGSENGQVVLMEKPSDSPMLKAINLPHGDDGHMPPEGKKQLAPMEKQLLEWWVGAGAPFEKKVAACNMPPELRTALLEQQQKKSSPLHALNLEPASEKTLNSLRAGGIPLQPMAIGSPFLQVSLSDRKDLSPTLLGKLKKVAKNIVVLDLGNSNADDKLLEIIKDLPHLNRLYLDQTAVTDKGVSNLAGLDFLEYLNLYKTQVSDEGIKQLAGLKSLKSIYLWQTAVSEKGITKFASLLPDVMMNKGVENDSMFGDVALKPPVIVASKELFTDTVHLTLREGFGKVNLHYTLDGSAPDSTSAIYKGPIVLSASTEIKAIAIKAGWTSSEIVSKQFFKMRYQAKEVSLASPPNPKYAGEGGKTLADFKKGTLNFGAGGWIGYQGQHLTATLDMGKRTELTTVTVGVLENTGSWIFFPKGLRISISTDGKTYKKVKETSYPVASEAAPPTLKNISEKFAPAKARFVKVEVLSNLKNPKWHPEPGKPCWVFVDEILVE